jgi:hypothetical protein
VNPGLSAEWFCLQNAKNLSAAAYFPKKTADTNQKPTGRTTEMKKLIAITGVILISCVCAGSLWAPSAASTQPQTTCMQEKTEPDGYKIADSGGHVAVFYADAPLLTTDTLTDSLPHADAKRVREGIPAKTRKEIEKLLEDFCS